jgi:hypothetical protein
MDLEDLDWAPSGGWAPSGRVELIVGHTYAVVTAERRYAKFEVVEVDDDRVLIDWAFQTDRDNRELSTTPPPVVPTGTPDSQTEGSIPRMETEGEAS